MGCDSSSLSSKPHDRLQCRRSKGFSCLKILINTKTFPIPAVGGYEVCLPDRPDGHLLDDRGHAATHHFHDPHGHFQNGL